MRPFLGLGIHLGHSYSTELAESLALPEEFRSPSAWPVVVVIKDRDLSSSSSSSSSVIHDVYSPPSSEATPELNPRLLASWLHDHGHPLVPNLHGSLSHLRGTSKMLVAVVDAVEQSNV